MKMLFLKKRAFPEPFLHVVRDLGLIVLMNLPFLYGPCNFAEISLFASSEVLQFEKRLSEN